MSRSIGKYAVTFFVLSVFDRMTKTIALVWCLSEKVMMSCVSYETVLNRGLALSIGGHGSLWTVWLSFGAAGIVTLYCCFYAYTLWRRNQSLWGIGSIIVGAFSNMTDRIFYGGVIDFIVIHYHDWVFPTFNVADVMICCGVALLIMQHREANSE